MHSGRLILSSKKINKECHFGRTFPLGGLAGRGQHSFNSNLPVPYSGDIFLFFPSSVRCPAAPPARPGSASQGDVASITRTSGAALKMHDARFVAWLSVARRHCGPRLKCCQRGAGAAWLGLPRAAGPGVGGDASSRPSFRVRASMGAKAARGWRTGGQRQNRGRRLQQGALRRCHAAARGWPREPHLTVAGPGRSRCLN